MNTIFTVRKVGTKFDVFTEEVFVSGDSIQDVLQQLKALGFEKVNMQEGWNPLRTSTVEVIKRVKQETYDKNPDKYSEFSYDVDNGADYNEFYKLLVNKEGKGLLIRLQND